MYLPNSALLFPENFSWAFQNAHLLKNLGCDVATYIVIQLNGIPTIFHQSVSVIDSSALLGFLLLGTDFRFPLDVLVIGSIL